MSALPLPLIELSEEGVSIVPRFLCSLAQEMANATGRNAFAALADGHPLLTTSRAVIERAHCNYNVHIPERKRPVRRVM